MGIDDQLRAAQADHAARNTAEADQARAWEQRKDNYDREEADAIDEIVARVHRTMEILRLAGDPGAHDIQVALKRIWNSGKVRGWRVDVEGHTSANVLGTDGWMYAIRLPYPDIHSQSIVDWATALVLEVRVDRSSDPKDDYHNLFEVKHDQWHDRLISGSTLPGLRTRLGTRRKAVLDSMGAVLDHSGVEF